MDEKIRYPKGIGNPVWGFRVAFDPQGQVHAVKPVDPLLGRPAAVIGSLLYNSHGRNAPCADFSGPISFEVIRKGRPSGDDHYKIKKKQLNQFPGEIKLPFS